LPTNARHHAASTNLLCSSNGFGPHHGRRLIDCLNERKQILPYRLHISLVGVDRCLKDGFGDEPFVLANQLSNC
jgi:hypothetical protein